MHEATDELIGLRAGEHAVDLSGEHVGFLQVAGTRELEQGLVGRSAPKEIGKPDGEFVGVQRPCRLSYAGFGEVKEPRRGEDDAQGFLQRLLEAVAGLAPRVVESDEFVQVARVRTFVAEGAHRELRDDLAGVIPFRLAFGLGR